LAGCDYLTNIPKFGIGWAYKYVQEYDTIEDVFIAIDAKKKVNGEKLYNIPNEYNVNFSKAKNTFLHQVVFDIVNKEQRRLNKVIDTKHDIMYAGELLDQLRVIFF
jgi:exonuclease 1